MTGTLLATILGTLLAVSPPHQVWRLHLGVEALAGGEFCHGVTGDCDQWNKDANRVAAVLRSDVAGFVGEPLRRGVPVYVRPGVQWLTGPWHSPTVSIVEPFLECVAAFGAKQFFLGVGGVFSSHGSRGAMVWFGLGGATAVEDEPATPHPGQSSGSEMPAIAPALSFCANPQRRSERIPRPSITAGSVSFPVNPTPASSLTHGSRSFRYCATRSR